MAVYLVCYDIIDDRERTRVAHLLEQYGQRVQDSVFEIHRIDVSSRKRLVKALKAECEDPASVRLYRLTRDGIEDSKDLAGRALATRPAMIVI